MQEKNETETEIEIANKREKISYFRRKAISGSLSGPILPVRFASVRHLSPTAVDQYGHCGRQFFFSRILGIKMPPAIAMIEGSCHHEALKRNNLSKMKTGKDFKLKKMIKFFREMLADETRGFKRKDWQGETINNITERAKDLLNNYLSKAPYILPIEAEKEHNTKFGKVPVKLFIDLIARIKSVAHVCPGVVLKGDRKLVVDYKVVARSKSQRDVDRDPQLTAYAKAAKCRDVAFFSFIKTSRDIRVVVGKRTPQDIAIIEQWYRQIWESIKSGFFPLAHPLDFRCDPRFCGYWPICRGKKRKGTERL